jgi:hypothetical protein
MARQALQQRLRDIDMSKEQSEVYQAYLEGIRKEIQQLKGTSNIDIKPKRKLIYMTFLVILNELQAKSRERTWLKQQTSGDLDENRLVEGLYPLSEHSNHLFLL